MRKKIGTIIALTSPKLNGELYLSENDNLTPNIGMAKTFIANKKVLKMIAAEAIVRFPQMTASTIERWEEIN